MTETAHGVDRLRGKTSLKEILEVATQFEASARDFYSGMAPKVSKRIRFLVEALAEEEQQHYDLFSNLAQRPDIAEQIKQDIQRTTADSKFSDCIQLPDMGNNPDDQTVLQYAMGREQAAMDHYSELASSAPPGPIQDLFIFLAKEETEHKLELEKIYYELIHRGGGV